MTICLEQFLKCVESVRLSKAICLVWDFDWNMCILDFSDMDASGLVMLLGELFGGLGGLRYAIL